MEMIRDFVIVYLGIGFLIAWLCARNARKFFESYPGELFDSGRCEIRLKEDLNAKESIICALLWPMTHFWDVDMTMTGMHSLASICVTGYTNIVYYIIITSLVWPGKILWNGFILIILLCLMVVFYIISIFINLFWLMLGKKTSEIKGG